MLLTNIDRGKGALAILLFVFLLAIFLVIPAPADAQSGASILIQPASGRAAAAIKITGSKFQPGEEVDIILQVAEIYHGLGTEKADAVIADKNGNFDVATGIPVRTPPGVYKIEATGNKGSAAHFNLEVLR